MKTDRQEIVIPSFILGGAPKSGTTSLYHYLEQHPDVCMSARKETSVFIENRSLEWLSNNHYRHYEGEAAVGEASAGTLNNPDVAARVHSALPDVRLIFILRDPVKRLYSHISFLQSIHAMEADVTFSSFIRAESAWRDTLIDIGRYHKHLTRFEQYFDREQMLVLLFEDFIANTERLVEQVYQFIGVDSSFQPDLTVRNMTREPRFALLHRILSSTWQSIRKYLDEYTANRTQALRGLVKHVISEEADRNPMPAEDAGYLRAIYREPNRQLQHWLGRDLSHWT